MDDLTGKVALVTGSSRGIGCAAAVALAQAGSAVAINYRSHEDKARETLRMIQAVGAHGALAQADVSVGREVARMVGIVEQKLGPIDILVNNAGIIRPQAIEDIREEDWDDLIDINLKSAFLVRASPQPLRDQGDQAVVMRSLFEFFLKIEYGDFGYGDFESRERLLMVQRSISVGVMEAGSSWRRLLRRPG